MSKQETHTQKPPYADYDAPHKFMAIEAIIGKRLIEHPHAICSYSGGSDSDILLHLIERARKIFSLPPVDYAFYNTGLEMEAIKRHVREAADKYGVNIVTVRPKKSIVTACRQNGLPFMSKIMSDMLGRAQRHGIPLTIVDEYERAEDKPAKMREITERYPHCKSAICYLLSCNSAGEPMPDNQLEISSYKYIIDFIREHPIPFRLSNRCCDICKKQPAHAVQKGYEMVITGERRAEGGMRSVPRKDNTALCFTETANGTYRLRPLYYVTDEDKAWYKEHYNIRYSDAYEVYGLTRTGCCGCPISSKAVTDLEKIRPYEPNLVKAAWKVFGASYEYRAKYNEYRAKRNAENRQNKARELLPLEELAK